jgi:hypothetical protein
MGSAQERILEAGRKLGEFTSYDIAPMAYGGTSYEQVNATCAKLRNLERWGLIVRVGTRRCNKVGNRNIVWRVV